MLVVGVRWMAAGQGDRVEGAMGSGQYGSCPGKVGPLPRPLTEEGEGGDLG